MVERKGETKGCLIPGGGGVFHNILQFATPFDAREPQVLRGQPACLGACVLKTTLRKPGGHFTARCPSGEALLPAASRKSEERKDEQEVDDHIMDDGDKIDKE